MTTEKHPTLMLLSIIVLTGGMLIGQQQTPAPARSGFPETSMLKAAKDQLPPTPASRHQICGIRSNMLSYSQY